MIPRSKQLILSTISCACILFFILSSWSRRSLQLVVQDAKTGLSVDTVVVQLKNDDTTWYKRLFPHWNHKIYVVDDPKAPLTILSNKGRESMAYLTYIVDNYDNLPDVAIFLHADRFQWHNDDPDYDGYGVLDRVQLPYILLEGYVNLRCAWSIGCPAEIRPLAGVASDNNDRPTEKYYKKAFEELFPAVELPKTIGVPCCAQFAVSGARIKQRPKSDYQHYLQWLSETEHDDATSGRIFEYSWHMIFGKPAQHCPNAKDCYCKLFGLCGLECTEDRCEGRYKLPQYASLPKGWPRIDWDKSERQFHGPD